MISNDGAQKNKPPYITPSVFLSIPCQTKALQNPPLFLICQHTNLTDDTCDDTLIDKQKNDDDIRSHDQLTTDN